MTNEQILEELKKIKMHSSTPTSEEKANINNEVSEIDASIEEYNDRIAELEAKLSNSNNYAYNNENEERTFTVELLQESFENQLEVMDREDAEYRHLQELATNLFTDYNNKIASLNVEIEAIERRLRKNEVAVRKNMRVQLSSEELNDLQSELAEKKARVVTCNEMKEKYIADLSNYGELITANNRKRQLVMGKQNSLNRIVENRKNNPVTVNKHQLRLDQDELSRLKAGVNALKSRKEYITYNLNDEIDKLMTSITSSKDDSVSEMETKPLDENVKETENLTNLYNQEEVNLGIPDGFLLNTLETPISKKENDTTIVAPLVSNFEDISSHSEGETPISEEEKEEDEVIDLIAAPSDLDEEREAEIEEAKEELKEKKKDPKFVALWKKFSKRAKKITTAAIAIGLTGVLILSLKSCGNDNTKQPTDITSDTSYSQTVDDSSNIDISSPTVEQDKTPDGSDKLEDNGKKPSVSDKTEEQDKKPVVSDKTEDQDKEPDASDKTEDQDKKPDASDKTEDQDKKPDASDKTEDQDKKPDASDKTEDQDKEPEIPDKPDTNVDTETIELEQGEKIASLEDILNGNINEDTVISHGDEVGKTIDGATVKDYTEDGNIEVELENKKEQDLTSSVTPNEPEQNLTSSRTPEEIKKALEEFMGGEITFDNDGNQWLDEIQSGKTR